MRYAFRLRWRSEPQGGPPLLLKHENVLETSTAQSAAGCLGDGRDDFGADSIDLRLGQRLGRGLDGYRDGDRLGSRLDPLPLVHVEHAGVTDQRLVRTLGGPDQLFRLHRGIDYEGEV